MLKRKILLLTNLAIILLCFFNVNVKGAYNVIADQTYEYDIIKHEIKIDDEIYRGFEINGHDFEEGTTVTVKVTSVDSNNVYWNLSANSYTESRISEVDDVDLLNYFMQINVYSDSLDDNNSLIDLIPFLHVDVSIWDSLEYFAEEFSSTKTTENGNIMRRDSYYEETSDYVILETMQYMEVGVEPIYIKDESNFQCVYNKITGVLQGIHIIGYLKLTIFTTVVYQYESHYELVDYDLTKMEFAPGYTFFLAFSGILIVTIIIFVKKRIRKEN